MFLSISTRRRAITSNTTYPAPTPKLLAERAALAPDTDAAFRAFSRTVFADAALTAKVKQLIAVAVAHVTQCPYCIRGHTRGAAKAGATAAEIMEAIWVAAEMRAGAAVAHSAFALDELERSERGTGEPRPGGSSPCVTPTGGAR